LTGSTIGGCSNPFGYVPPAEYEANYYQQLEGCGARRHPDADTVIDGTAAEHPQDFLPTVPKEVQMPEQMTANSHYRPPMNPGRFNMR
jgi:hypothetical protein